MPPFFIAFDRHLLLTIILNCINIDWNAGDVTNVCMRMQWHKR